jgi:hypothetical protein
VLNGSHQFCYFMAQMLYIRFRKSRKNSLSCKPDIHSWIVSRPVARGATSQVDIRYTQNDYSAKFAQEARLCFVGCIRHGEAQADLAGAALAIAAEDDAVGVTSQFTEFVADVFTKPNQSRTHPSGHNVCIYFATKVSSRNDSQFAFNIRTVVLWAWVVFTFSQVASR